MATQEIRQSPGADLGFFYGYIVVIVAFLIMTVMFGVYVAFGVFFNPMLTDFGWTRAMTSGAFSLSMIMFGLLGIVMGGLNDRVGPQIVLSVCGFLFGLGCLLMSQISAVWQLYLFYGVIIGIGIAGSWVPLVSTVARWFARRRSTMTGIVLAGTGVGGLIGPPVANWLIAIYGWRASYFILGSIVLVVVVLAAQFLRRDPARMGQRPYGGKNEAEEQRFNSDTEGFSLKEAVSTRQFWVVCGLEFCFGFCVYVVIVHIVPHAINLGISVASAANILAMVGGLTIVGRVVLGSVADRIGNRQVFIIGFMLMLAAFFWLAPVAVLWMLYLFAVVFGFANGGMGPSESPLVARLFGLSFHGLIYGIIVLGFTIGAAIGPLLAGYIFDITGGYQVAFLVSAAVSISGLVLTVVLRPIRGAGVKI